MSALAEELPSDIDVEYALIGWVLTDNRTVHKLGDLSAEDFYSGAHADVFHAIEALAREGEPITPFTIKPRLRKPDTYELTGGVYKYLAGSLEHARVHPFPEDQAKYLLRLSRERSLVQACREVTYGESLEAKAARLSEAVSRAMTSGRVKLLDNYDVGAAVLDDLKDTRRPFSTGIPLLDEAMGGGLYPGKSYGIAARKKVGKTALAATISANLNDAGAKHLFICGEMSAKEIHQRVLSRRSDTFPSAFRSEYGKKPGFETRVAEVVRAAPRNTLYADAPGLTFDELRHIVTGAVEMHRVTGFILDYWQLVGGKAKSKSTAEHLDEVAQWVADVGRKLGLWSVTMAQINQEGNTRGGEGIRLAFDQVYQLHREDLSAQEAWIEMMETRYTPWANVGSKESPLLSMNEKGPYFEQHG